MQASPPRRITSRRLAITLLASTPRRATSCRKPRQNATRARNELVRRARRYGSHTNASNGKAGWGRPSRAKRDVSVGEATQADEPRAKTKAGLDDCVHESRAIRRQTQVVGELLLSVPRSVVRREGPSLQSGDAYFSPHSRSLLIVGASSAPDSVSRYSSRGGCSLYRRRLMTPASSSFFRRIVSVSRVAPVL